MRGSAGRRKGGSGSVSVCAAASVESVAVESVECRVDRQTDDATGRSMRHGLPALALTACIAIATGEFTVHTTDFNVTYFINNKFISSPLTEMKYCKCSLLKR